ncbi:MAG: diguanylate cyclase, partial [Pseudomonadota bacterium]
MSNRVANKHAGLDRPPRGEQRDPLEASGRLSAVERSRSDRRDHTRAQSSLVPPASDPGQGAVPEHEFYLPPKTRPMALFIALTFVVSAGVAQAVLIGLPAIAAAISIALLWAGNTLASLERRETASHASRVAILLVGVALPMASAGFALGSFVQIGLPWQWAVATMVCINAASASLFGRRIASLFVAKISIWAAFALIHPSLLTIMALIGALLALALIARLDWKDAQERLQEREARERVAARAEDILRSFEETGQGWFFETDRRGLISYISHSAASALDKSVHELVGRPLAEIVESSSNGSDAERTLAFHLSARSAFHEIELKAAGTESERWWSITGRPVYDSFKNFCGFRGHGTDLTEKRRSEHQVSRLAHYDSLTGLANRLQMSQTLERILAAPRERDRNCAVLLLDLDRFKHVNDTLGHPAGDALLTQVAQRLEHTTDGKGRCGRLGGDEFQVIVPA